jgi:hypothetical protein
MTIVLLFLVVVAGLIGAGVGGVIGVAFGGFRAYHDGAAWDLAGLLTHGLHGLLLGGLIGLVIGMIKVASIVKQSDGSGNWSPRDRSSS